MAENVSNTSKEVFEEDPIHDPSIQSIFCIGYTIIFVLGMFGNVLTVFVVCRNKDMQTVTNFFIANLALSDILLCTLSVPFTPLYTFLNKWVLGKLMCHLVSSAQGISVYVSTLTLTSIAIDRFFVIIYPFRQRMKITTCFLIIFSTWLISVLAVLPYGIFLQHYPVNDTYLCEESWPNETVLKVYGVITIVLQFVLPFLIIAFCYIKISFRLNDQTHNRPGVTNPRREAMERTRKQRTNRMLVAMVLIFGLCWLPFNVVNILNDFNNDILLWKYRNVCFFAVHVIAMSSTCYNPFLYSWLNENFRKEFKQVLPGFQQTHENPGRENGTLMTSTSVLRRSSSVRDRKTDRITETTVAYRPEEERVDFLGTDESSLLREGDSDRSSPSVSGGRQRVSLSKLEAPTLLPIGNSSGHLV